MRHEGEAHGQPGVRAARGLLLGSPLGHAVHPCTLHLGLRSPPRRPSADLPRWAPPLPRLPRLPHLQVLGSSTKTLSFFKPTEDDLFAAGGSAQAAAEAAAAEVAIEGLQDE